MVLHSIQITLCNLTHFLLTAYNALRILASWLLFHRSFWTESGLPSSIRLIGLFLFELYFIFSHFLTTTLKITLFSFFFSTKMFQFPKFFLFLFPLRLLLLNASNSYNFVFYTLSKCQTSHFQYFTFKNEIIFLRQWIWTHDLPLKAGRSTNWAIPRTTKII